ncbi:MAG: 30S ribosomal protein S6 [Deltaproteobacteria bacterium]|jgi:small subunit ribosomal protein S6|nr:30S ribosomal protein S6 [Deltaproteobacteria bacterium]
MENNKDYETVIVYDASLDETVINKELAKIEELINVHGGIVKKKTIAGRKKLAYKINHKEFGVYVLLVHSGDSKIGSDLERQFQINTAVLRHLVVKKDKYAPDGEIVLDDSNVSSLLEEETVDIIEELVEEEVVAAGV